MTRLAVSGLRGIGLLVAQRALHTAGVELVAVNDPHLSLADFIAFLNKHRSATQGGDHSYSYKGNDQTSRSGPSSARACNVEVKKMYHARRRGASTHKHQIRWYAKKAEECVAWRGDDPQAEAKVNLHVLVDCLSSTVRGAQVHAGSGCSVVILLASAPQASALGPSVHELRVLQAVGTDPEVLAHPNLTRLYSAGSCATRAMAALAKMIHSKWKLRGFEATCICVNRTLHAPALLAANCHETFDAPLCVAFSYPQSEAGIVDVRTTEGFDGAPEVTVTPGRRPTPII